MAYKINDNCISCGGCVNACPTDAIVPGDSTYIIKEDDCIDCGSCVSFCPVDAISG